MSGELVMVKSKEIFTIDKDILSFKINPDYVNKSSISKPTVRSGNKLEISNITNKYIACRIKTTKKLYYTINPSYFVIPPNSNIKINFLYFLIPGEKVSSNGHKFKIEGFIISDSEKDESVKKIFSKYSSNKIKVEGGIQKIFVQFVEDKEYVEPKISRINVSDFEEKKIKITQTKSKVSLHHNQINQIVPQYNNNVKKLENQNNENVAFENKALKIENENLKKEIESLKYENQILKNENINLKNNLDYFNSINKEKINELIEKCRVLNEEKMTVNNHLILKLNSNTTKSKNYNELPYGERLVAVNFISVDQKINHSIVCTNKSKFYEIEDNLYKKYPEYKENDNYFMCNGFKINRWNTLEENEISGYNIILNTIDNK